MIKAADEKSVRGKVVRDKREERKVWDSNFDLSEVSDARKKKPFFEKRLSFGQFLISQLLILFVGLALIAGLYYLVNQDTLFKSKGYIVPVTIQSVGIYLEVTNPEDNTLVFDNSIVVSGKTLPQASVVVVSQENFAGVEANSLGEFSKVFPLKEGLNIIRISAFDEQGESQVLQRQVYYSKEKLDEN